MIRTVIIKSGVGPFDLSESNLAELFGRSKGNVTRNAHSDYKIWWSRLGPW